MRRINLGAAVATAGMSCSALAGPYSSGLANTNEGATDPALRGLVGEAVNPLFAGWASAVASYEPAPGVAAGWNDPSKALGPVIGDNFDIVSLGDTNGGTPGRITLSFSSGIGNAAGPDFAVFENSLGTDRSVFAELAYVEVSSDGEHFARFSSASLTPTAVGPYGSIDPTDVHNLAGKHINAYGESWGTPFDLTDLASDPLVQSGQVNLNGIKQVRLIDIPGDGTWRDSSNRPIYDAWLTFGSGGFDLEAIGVTHAWLGGDADLNGAVDVNDLGIIASNWQQAGEWARGDFDGSGTVDVNDLGILASNWQSGAGSFPGLLSVPEPGFLGAVLAGLMMCRRRVAACLVLLAALICATYARGATVNLEDKTLAPNSFYNGSDGAGGFTSGGAHFNNSYNPSFGSWSGFAYSNVNNTTTPGFGNQYAAITGSGFGGGGNYAVAFDTSPFGTPPTITLPFVASVQSVRVTNTTYAFLALRDGNDGFGAVRQFGDDPNLTGTGNQGFPDTYKLTITGKDGAGQVTGAVQFYLADYRFASNADDYVVSDWTSVDLSSLGNVKTLTFALDSTDTGQFGINTPTYFALDELNFVPEPSAGLGFLYLAASLATRFGRCDRTRSKLRG
jgi:hypothetical protein